MSDVDCEFSWPDKPSSPPLTVTRSSLLCYLSPFFPLAARTGSCCSRLRSSGCGAASPRAGSACSAPSRSSRPSARSSRPSSAPQNPRRSAHSRSPQPLPRGTLPSPKLSHSPRQRKPPRHHRRLWMRPRPRTPPRPRRAPPCTCRRRRARPARSKRACRPRQGV